MRVASFPGVRTNKENIRSRDAHTLTLVIMHERRGNRMLKYAKQRPMLQESKSLQPHQENFTSASHAGTEHIRI